MGFWHKQLVLVAAVIVNMTKFSSPHCPATTKPPPPASLPIKDHNSQPNQHIA